MLPSPDKIIECLRPLPHPEKGVSLVELSLVAVAQQGEGYLVSIGPLAPNDPFGATLTRAARRMLEAAYPNQPIEVTLIAPPRPESQPAEPSVGGVAGVKRIIPIVSGKGGVGKSTVSLNLAVGLARRGYRVGLLDADVFGPSQPIMMGVAAENPDVQQEEGEDLIVPIEAFGVKMLSMGFFVSQADALVWRGPMACNALKQLITMGKWGDLDFLLIDMPPGTSDIQLTVWQDLDLAGAVIVSTPQAVATADARKAISMCRNEHFTAPILGLVENMAWFDTPDAPHRRYYLFGKGGAEALAREEGIPYLGGVPLQEAICEGGDHGAPFAADNSETAKAFDAIVARLLEQLPQEAPSEQ